MTDIKCSFNFQQAFYAKAHKAFKFSSLFRTQIEAAYNTFAFALFVFWILQELLNLGSEHR
jgi:hypothetical protein